MTTETPDKKIKTSEKSPAIAAIIPDDVEIVVDDINNLTEAIAKWDHPEFNDPTLFPSAVTSTMREHIKEHAAKHLTWKRDELIDFVVSKFRGGENDDTELELDVTTPDGLCYSGSIVSLAWASFFSACQASLEDGEEVKFTAYERTTRRDPVLIAEFETSHPSKP